MSDPKETAAAPPPPMTVTWSAHAFGEGGDDPLGMGGATRTTAQGKRGAPPAHDCTANSQGGPGQGRR